jgi:hypothetical protein
MQNECYAGNVACVNTDVADAEVLNAFAAYVLVAGLVLTGFGFLRRHVPIYEGRSYLRSLRASGCAPPREPERRTVLGTVYGWIPHVLKVSDAELVDTAGLDALVFLRIAQFGTQLFIPLALAGMFGLVPIHLSQSFYETTVITKEEDENPLMESKEGHTLMKMTIANIKPRSRLMWTHVCGFWIITAYTLWLLHRHYRSYEFLRQVYGTTTGESNPWRAVHIPQTIIQKFLQQGIDTSREFATGEEGAETRSVQTMRRHSVTCRAPRVSISKASRRHSVVAPVPRAHTIVHRHSLYQKFTPSDQSARERPSQAEGPTSVDDVAWPVLLEMLLGPKRTQGREKVMSTEQKIKTFSSRPSVAGDAHLRLADPAAMRGYYSHAGPRPSSQSQVHHAPERSFDDLHIRSAHEMSNYPSYDDSSMPLSPASSISEISMAGMTEFNDDDNNHSLSDKQHEDVAIEHDWWEGLDIVKEAWPGSLETSQGRSSSDSRGSASSKELSVPRVIDIDLEQGIAHDSTSLDYQNPVPSIDDRRFISACDREIDEHGRHADVMVSVLVQNYCILMTDVGGNGKDGNCWEDMRAVERFFNGMFPEDFLMVIPLQDHRGVDDLLTDRDKFINEMRRLEMKPTSQRRSPSFRDATTELREKVACIEHLIVREREKILQNRPGPSCIVAFKSQYAAACAAQCKITSRRNDMFNVELAPGPDNLNWQAILIRRRQRELRAFLIFPLILTIILIPTGTFTGVMSSLCVANQFGTERSEALDWYCSSDSARLLRVVVQGILPPILLTLWETFIISFGMMYLVQAQSKYVSLSKTDESFARYYFFWAFVNVFLGTVSGYAIQRYLNALNNKGPDAMLQLLGTSLPLTSNFFLLWIVFRGIYLPTQRLIFPHPGVLCMIVNRWLCCLGCNVTARDRTIKYSPRSVRLGREVGVFSMVMMIGLVFSTVAPVITLLCATFFVFNFVIWRYHVLYVYERSYEAGGTMWNTFCNLTIYSLIIAQSFLSFVLLSKQAYAEALILWFTVLPILNHASHRFRSMAGDLKWSVPLPEAATAPRVEFNAETYVHPALKRRSVGWHPEIGKVWRGYPNVTVKRTRIFGR